MVYAIKSGNDTADKVSMWIGKSTNLNGQYIVGTANAIGDWSTTIFKAQGILSGAGYYAIRFYSNETIRYRYAGGYSYLLYCKNNGMKCIKEKRWQLIELEQIQ